jgi:aryl-alcohol dehydrogenase-like predicted oxidoreductase
LSGKYRSEADFSKSSARGGGMGSYLDARGKAILAALDQVAGAHRVSPATIAIAWLIARPTIVAPIASATSPEQLKDLVAATRLTLADDEIAALDRASAWR